MTFCFLGAFISLLLCNISDIKKREVPLIGMISFAAFNIGISCFADIGIEKYLGGIAAGICFFVYSVMTQNQFGRADAYFIFAYGILSGFFETLFQVFISLFVASCYGMYLLIRHKNKKYTYPLIPFLSIGYLLAIYRLVF